MLTLIAGDTLILALVTLYGFATHGELETAGLRMLTTFIPLALAWILIAPWLGLYPNHPAGNPNQFWRPALAAFLAAPMAGWLRGMWLSAPIQPIFVLVLAASLAAPMLIWRGVWSLLQRRQVNHG